MLKRRTVFVVGAGASREFGLPVGLALQRSIAELLDIRFDDGTRLRSGSRDIWRAFGNITGQDSNSLQASSWKVRDGLPLSNSIDNFMDVHRNDAGVRTVGGLAIAKAIIDAERQSSLFYSDENVQSEIDFNALQETWILKLFRYMQEGIPVQNVRNLFENATFIIFNYDRCLEHFMFRAVAALYDLPDQDAAEIVSALRVVHPYGTIGRLPWQQHDTSRPVKFGDDRPVLEEMAKRISTYTDEINDVVSQAKIHEWMMAAEQVCFLGFSFQEQNMKLLTPQFGSTARMLGTAYGMSEFDTDAVREDIASRFQTAMGNTGAANVRLERTQKCGDFLDSYSRAFR